MPEKKTSKSNPKKKIIFPSKNNQNSPPKINKYLKILNFLLEKKIIKPEEISENLLKKTEHPRKFRLKWARKISTREKTKKGAKNGFSGTFHLLGEGKKLWLMYLLREIDTFEFTLTLVTQNGT